MSNYFNPEKLLETKESYQNYKARLREIREEYEIRRNEYKREKKKTIKNICDFLKENAPKGFPASELGLMSGLSKYSVARNISPNYYPLCGQPEKPVKAKKMKVTRHFIEVDDHGKMLTGEIIDKTEAKAKNIYYVPKELKETETEEQAAEIPQEREAQRNAAREYRKGYEAGYSHGKDDYKNGIYYNESLAHVETNSCCPKDFQDGYANGYFDGYYGERREKSTD